MSRSRLIPGKTTTADFMAGRARAPLAPRSARPRRATRSFELNLVILDQGIGEELVGRLLERGLRRLAVAALDLDVEHLALPHARHAGDAKRLERALDRLALGIEDAGLEGDGNARLHRFSCAYGYRAIRSSRKSKTPATLPCVRLRARLSRAGDHPLTRTGPRPRGRSPSLMMPRRLATSV